METDEKDIEEKTEQFNVTFILGTAVVGVGVIMPEGTGEILGRDTEESEQLGASMVQASADSLSDEYGWDIFSYDIQDVMVESASF